MVKPIHAYVGGVCLVAIFLLAAVTDWQSLVSLAFGDYLGVSALALLAFFAESLSISLSIGGASASITFLPLLTCVLLFGPGPALVLVIVTGLVGERLIRRKSLLKTAFNVSQWTIGVAIGGWLFTQVGGRALATMSEAAPIGAQLIPLATFGLSFMIVNQLAVVGAIAINREAPLQSVVRQVVGREGGNVLYDLLVSPMALGVAFLYLELGWWGILLALLPLLFIRHAYLTAQRLQRANHDLLSALVKAIETRDPYTSGHSVRVAALSRRLGGELGLSRSLVENVATAALLHDIGKIDPVYVSILKKPGALSPHERAVIESHVTKGVELLQQLSSLPAGIIADVRHHHEREDGLGYPDRLSGDQIPIGAKIIKVCDAIDAMMSDRPYRAALSIGQVRDQLHQYAGTQFNQDVVGAVMASDLLGEHQRSLRGGWMPATRVPDEVARLVMAGGRAS